MSSERVYSPHMRKTFLLLSRITLMLGVLVALTPCGICRGSMEKASQACSMTHLSGKMDCCHKGKQSSPLCKVMDQSSTVSVLHGLETVSAPVVSFVSPLVATLTRVCFLSSTAVDT